MVATSGGIQMSEIITATTSVVTAAIGWAGQFVTFITENPLVLLFTILSLVGLGAGLVMRLIRG